MADLNLDGRRDVVVANSGDGTVTVLLGAGGGRLVPKLPATPCGSEPSDVDAVDLDRDGDADLVIANHETPKISVLLNDGKAQFRPAPGSPFDSGARPHVHGLATGDFNGDGWWDVAVESADTREVRVLRGGRRGLGEAVSIPVGTMPYFRLGAADVTGDGIPEVLVPGHGDNTVRFVQVANRELARSSQKIALSGQPWMVAGDDVTGDGRNDIIVVQTDAVSVWLVTAQGFSPAPGSPFSVAGAQEVATGDLDGDGIADMAVGPWDGTEVTLIEGRRMTARKVRACARPIGLAIADLDGDQRGELLATCGTENRLVVLKWARSMAVPPADAPPPSQSLDEAAATRFAHLALACLHKEYPNKISHVMLSDADALPPHVLTPAFYGCYDWHSGVHGHWLLVRLLRLFPNAPFAKDARAALSVDLTPQKIAGEVDYVENKARASFERPYGLAWLLQLSAELRSWDDRQGRQWAAALVPLETLAASKLKSWLPRLHYPIRIGEHDQTAFSFGLMWDWARIAGDAQMAELLVDAAERFYRGDRHCPLGYEPSGQDFLSPCLAEADFMRRVLAPAAFAKWLGDFLPQIPSRGGAEWLPPGVVTDRADPKLGHIDGLNLSRAWMLEGIAHGLRPGDKRVPALLAAAASHRAAALPAVTGEHYEGGHWLGTFAVYLTSQAGSR